MLPKYSDLDESLEKIKTEIKAIAVVFASATPVNIEDAFVVGRCYESCIAAWVDLDTAQSILGRTTKDFWNSETEK